MPRVLIIDDEPYVTRALRRLLVVHDYDVRVVHDPLQAPDAAHEFEPDAIILDLNMPGRDGLDLLPDLRAITPRSQVIVYTGTGNIEKAVAATKKGAYDFVVKADQGQEVLHSLKRALEARNLRQFYDQAVGPGSILVFSRKTRRVVELAKRYCATPDVPVLIQGESGTGKELIARLVHHDADDYSRPFVAINCGAIPRELVESELFGYVPGAFTGARASGSPGKVKAAEGGTLFLDEIGDLDLNSQVKFLRFLEHGTFYPVGGTEEQQVALRVVCASNRDLEQAIADGSFRRDLYYRVNVGHIRIPPLRERPEEIVPFARHFLAEFSRRFHRRFDDIHPDAEHILRNARWDGNVRELRHVIERIVLIQPGPIVLPQHVAFLCHNGRQEAPPPAPDAAPPAALPGPAEAPLPPEGLDLGQVTLRLIERALEKHNYNQSRTARYLHITRETLRYRMRKLKK